MEEPSEFIFRWTDGTRRRIRYLFGLSDGAGNFLGRIFELCKPVCQGIAWDVMKEIKSNIPIFTGWTRRSVRIIKQKLKTTGHSKSPRYVVTLWGALRRSDGVNVAKMMVDGIKPHKVSFENPHVRDWFRRKKGFKFYKSTTGKWYGDPLSGKVKKGGEWIIANKSIAKKAQRTKLWWSKITVYRTGIGGKGRTFGKRNIFPSSTFINAQMNKLGKEARKKMAEAWKEGNRFPKGDNGGFI